MAKSITEIINEIIRIEGDAYTNDPTDRGGPTKYGITQATLTKWRKRPVTPAEVAALTRNEAFEIYFIMYVVDPGFDKVRTLSSTIAAELVDTGVNMGQGTAGKFLQRALNALSGNQTKGADLVVDGVVGNASLKALQAYLGKRGKEGERILLVLLNGLQATQYVLITEGNTSQRKYFYGWMNHRVAAQV